MDVFYPSETEDAETSNNSTSVQECFPESRVWIKGPNGWFSREAAPEDRERREELLQTLKGERSRKEPPDSDFDLETVDKELKKKGLIRGKTDPRSLEAYKEHLSLHEETNNPSPEEELIAEEERAQMHAAIGRLKNMKQRKALELMYLGGMSQREIANTLSCSVGYVKQLIHRGKQSLLEQLSNHEER